MNNDNLNEIIKEILESERDILKCVNKYVCRLLKDIYNDKSLCKEQVVYLYKYLLSAAAKKEEGAANVITALAELEYVEEHDFIWLQPGESIPVCDETDKNVEKVEFNARTESGNSEIALLIEDEIEFSQPISVIELYNLWPVIPPTSCIYLTLKNIGEEPICISNLEVHFSDGE